MKAFVIGRHNTEDLPVEVVEQENVQFPETATECMPVVDQLVLKAGRLEAALLFQAVPAQLAVALSWMHVGATRLGNYGVGYVISKPGARPAGTVASYETTNGEIDELAGFISKINPRLKVEKRVTINRGPSGDATLVITVDLPMPLIFSHVEWLETPYEQPFYVDVYTMKKAGIPFEECVLEGQTEYTNSLVYSIPAKYFGAITVDSLRCVGCLGEGAANGIFTER